MWNFLKKKYGIFFGGALLMSGSSQLCYAYPTEFLPWIPYVIYLNGKEMKMSIKPKQLRGLITDVLMYLDLYSEDAVELLMLTAAQESHCGTYIKQVRGPALGIFQCEPATAQDIYDNYLTFKPDLESLIDSVSLLDQTASEQFDLKANLVYQIAMARIHYMRDKQAIPSKDDMAAQAAYYKRVWNTPLGKATEEEALDNYYRYGVK